mmetsp:Transcript_6463/g.15554  ORF Transcript_6463/g.15554 Transcript_6463/m.15554 type:complete len:321 (-) Transcript_6463:88-1050(-)
MTSSWESLPPEILVSIFQRIKGCQSRKSARSVCKRWHESHGLSVYHLNPVELDPVKITQRFPYVISLDLRRRTRGEHPPGLLTALSSLKNLKKLNLDSCRQATDEGLAQIQELRELSALILSHCWWIKGPGLRHLSALSKLQTLSLSGCDISCEGLDAVAALPSLTALDLSFCWHLGDRGVMTLQGAAGLRSLSVAGTSIRDEGVEVVRSLPSLTRLDLGGCEITDASARVLGGCPQLRTLSVQQSYITDAGLEHLAEVPALEDLNLAQCALVAGDGLGLAALGAHPRLARLCLKGCPLRETGLGIVRDLTQNPAKEVVR